MAPSNQTPFPTVNTLLALLLREVRAILGADLVGVYSYGSLSLGDFDPGSSDIDFLVVTERELSEQIVAELGAMHTRIAASGLPWADKLEGSYIPHAALRRFDAANNRHPTIGLDWDFGITEHGSNWVIERHIVREHGVIIAGPPPETLIDPVTPDALRAATWDALDHFWRDIAGGPEPEWLRTREYQAFAILTMCRALYTLDHGGVVSKPVTATWAGETLPSPWPTLIAKALTWRHDTRPDDMTAMLAFVRYTVERASSAGGM
ncbi:MAG: aminoglycoside adenylyltransferase domain-containing protein [Thermomicrobiales bacterium]